MPGCAVAGGAPPARDAARLVLFKPSGTAAQDLAVGRVVYERCRAAGRGRAIEGLVTPRAR